MDAWKRPRTLDVDVVAVGDTGDGDLERVRTLIQPVDNTQASDVEQDIEPDDLPATAVDTELPALVRVDIRTDVCDACGSEEPPPCKRRLPKEIRWLGCDSCPRWFHTLCVGVKTIPDEYICDMCS